MYPPATVSAVNPSPAQVVSTPSRVGLNPTSWRLVRVSRTDGSGSHSTSEQVIFQAGRVAGDDSTAPAGPRPQPAADSSDAAPRNRPGPPAPGRPSLRRANGPRPRGGVIAGRRGGGARYR